MHPLLWLLSNLRSVHTRQSPGFSRCQILHTSNVNKCIPVPALATSLESVSCSSPAAVIVLNLQLGAADAYQDKLRLSTSCTSCPARHTDKTLCLLEAGSIPRKTSPRYQHLSLSPYSRAFLALCHEEGAKLEPLPAPIPDAACSHQQTQSKFAKLGCI